MTGHEHAYLPAEIKNEVVDGCWACMDHVLLGYVAPAHLATHVGTGPFLVFRLCIQKLARGKNNAQSAMLRL